MKPTYKVIIPTDFSDCSINAIRYATHLLKRFRNVKITLLHTYTVRVAYSELAFTDETADDEISNEFELINQIIPELEEFEVTTHVEKNELLNTLPRLCREKEFDLVVMGTQGANSLEDEFLGTNTFAAINSSKCPVLVVPQNAELRDIRNIVLASDYQSIDSQILNPLKEINNVCGSAINILHISDKDKIDELHAVHAKKLEQYLHKVQHHFHFFKSDDIENGILNFIDEHNSDLLCLIPRKHRFFQLMFGTSQSKKLIFHSQVPILALPA
ncbi:MAG: universal stress protein [Fulvivirga sp.]